ncbi:GNAT family N-acetyltransferase [Streptomyces sp. NPDC058664]|uniref:GNAT family N-acetyltransferase n=1 Tax=unclassified Streptomyces TaxID=2593676 RepID=UPI003659BB3B
MDDYQTPIDRIALREFSADDQEIMCRIWGDSRVAKHTAFDTMSADQVAATLEQAAADARKVPRETYTLAVSDAISGEAIGSVSLVLGPEESGYGRWLTIKPSLWSSGIGRAAVALFLELAFRDLSLHRVWCVTTLNNPTAGASLEAAGFTRDGVIRDFCRKGGEWCTVHHYSILNYEWRKSFRDRGNRLELATLSRPRESNPEGTEGKQGEKCP